MTKEEAIKKIEETIEDVRAFASAKVEGIDPATKEKVKLLVDKTAKVIDEAKDKVVEVAKSVQDDEKLNAFLNTVISKVQEAADFTKTKISELTPNQEKVEEVEKQISDSFDKFMANENVQGAVQVVKNAADAIQEFLNKPETKAKINKAKKVTLNVAEKGMDKLRIILATDEVSEEAEVETIVIEDENK